MGKLGPHSPLNNAQWDWIAKVCLEERFSVKQIAECFGLSNEAVYAHLRMKGVTPERQYEYGLAQLEARKSECLSLTTPAYTLNNTQIKVVQMMCECNMSISAVGKKLHYTRGGIQYHLRRILEKTGYDCRKHEDLDKLMELINEETE